MKLASIRLFVRDLEPARRFYSETLGLPLEAHDPAMGYCLFRQGEVLLLIEIIARDADADDQALVGRFTGVTFRVDDIEAELHRLSGLGVKFTGLPELQPWGGTMATFKDPAGNELQLVQYAPPVRKTQ
jgi:catechol 2,3-dioxygenase-like lactoylglutathione lyase family enzyme